jgi:hypothetical protein
MEDRVWVSLEGRASAPVLLGFGSFSVGSSPLSVGFSGNDHRKSDLRWSLLSGFCLSDSLSPSRLSLSLSLGLSISLLLPISLFLCFGQTRRKEEESRKGEKGSGHGLSGFVGSRVISGSLPLNVSVSSLTLTLSLFCFPPSHRLSLSHSVSFVS